MTDVILRFIAFDIQALYEFFLEIPNIPRNLSLNTAMYYKSSVAPNEGRNNWCHFELRDFDFETFRDFFRLRDQKTSGAKARWHSLEGRPCL